MLTISGFYRKGFWDFVVSLLMVILRHISLTDFIALFNFTWTPHGISLKRYPAQRIHFAKHVEKLQQCHWAGRKHQR